MSGIRPVATDAAPGAVGPYSQGMRTFDLLYTAGQIPLSPETGEIVGGTVAEQTEQVLKNLKAILRAGDSGIDKVVKTTVFLTDLGAFAEMNEVYAKHFPEPAPARSCVEVNALPKGALVEIEAVAVSEQK